MRPKNTQSSAYHALIFDALIWIFLLYQDFMVDILHENQSKYVFMECVLNFFCISYWIKWNKSRKSPRAFILVLIYLSTVIRALMLMPLTQLHSLLRNWRTLYYFSALTLWGGKVLWSTQFFFQILSTFPHATELTTIRSVVINVVDRTFCDIVLWRKTILCNNWLKAMVLYLFLFRSINPLLG